MIDHKTNDISRLGMWGMCMQDAPLGIRDSEILHLRVGFASHWLIMIR